MSLPQRALHAESETSMTVLKTDSKAVNSDSAHPKVDI